MPLDNKNPNSVNNLNLNLHELNLETEEETKLKIRKIIHSYIDDFKNFDTESIHAKVDFGIYVESF